MEGMAMTYTLAMATESGIEIADDGVAEVSMTKARAALTELIRGVRWGGSAGAFTERGARVAIVVPPDFYEQALADRLTVEAMKRALRGLSEEEIANNKLLHDFAKHLVSSGD